MFPILLHRHVMARSVATWPSRDRRTSLAMTVLRNYESLFAVKPLESNLLRSFLDLTLIYFDGNRPQLRILKPSLLAGLCFYLNPGFGNGSAGSLEGEGVMGENVKRSAGGNGKALLAGGKA